MSHCSLIGLSAIPDSKSHPCVQWETAYRIIDEIKCLIRTIDHAAIRFSANLITGFDPTAVEVEGKVYKEPDGSFGLVTTYIPSFVCEIAECKRYAIDYIKLAGADVRALLILDMTRTKPTQATVSWLVADDSHDGFRWAEDCTVMYDDDGGEHQPLGVVEFYLSDFIGPANLPMAFCRPAAGISRFVLSPQHLFFLPLLVLTRARRSPQFTISYQELGVAFCNARHFHDPATYHFMEGHRDHFSITIALTRLLVPEK